MLCAQLFVCLYAAASIVRNVYNLFSFDPDLNWVFLLPELRCIYLFIFSDDDDGGIIYNWILLNVLPIFFCCERGWKRWHFFLYISFALWLYIFLFYIRPRIFQQVHMKYICEDLPNKKKQHFPTYWKCWLFVYISDARFLRLLMLVNLISYIYCAVCVCVCGSCKNLI